MKMGFLSSGVFWGGLIVLIGLSIILHVVGIRFPLFRVIIGLLFVYLGVSIMVGGFRRRSRAAVFSDVKVEHKGKAGDYDVVFGKGEIDLTKVDLEGATRHVDVSTVFGSSTIVIDPKTPVKLVLSSAFGGGQLPDGNTVAFGEYTYKTDAYQEGEPYLYVKASNVFGGTEVKLRTAKQQGSY